MTRIDSRERHFRVSLRVLGLLLLFTIIVIFGIHWHEICEWLQQPPTRFDIYLLIILFLLILFIVNG